MWLPEPCIYSGLISPIGRYCYKSRKSSCSENLAKVDSQTFLPLQGSIVALRRSVVVFERTQIACRAPTEITNPLNTNIKQNQNQGVVDAMVRK